VTACDCQPACKVKKCARCEYTGSVCTMSHKGAYCKPCGIRYRRAWGKARNYEQLWQKRRRLSDKGLTAEEYEELFAAQGSSCGVCGTAEPGSHNWAIDHDHSCCAGQRSCGLCVRGILCFHCNVSLGLLKDSPELLRKAATYIEEFKIVRRLKAV
jgi:hypothetical protein